MKLIMKTIPKKLKNFYVGATPTPVWLSPLEFEHNFPLKCDH